MLLTLPDVLSPQELSEIRALADTLTWRDGSATAGSAARQVKRNQQADLTADGGRVVHARLKQALERHALLRVAARPKRWSALLLSRTGVGGGYGAHIDNALMGSGAARMRSDLSFTLMLSEPDAFTGGELEVDRPGLVQTLAPTAGELVLYPSSSVHRVAPVTHGERLVCVGWIQSLVPDSRQRELLWDLENLRASLRATHDANSPELMTLSKSISNLTRMWADI